MARVEFAEQGRDPEVAHRVRCGNAQPASRSTLQLAYRTFRLVEIERNALAMLEIDVAGLGQSELAGCAVQQLCAQSLFQDRKSTRLNSSHYCASRMPSSA